MKGNYHLVSETPEMERVRANQRHISSVSSKEEVGRGTAVMDTPELERVRRNQENISAVSAVKYLVTQTLPVFQQIKYKQSSVKSSSLGVTPELERVRQNQDNISSVKYRRGLQELRGRSCTELDTPEYRRVRKSQDSVSMVAAACWLPWRS
uniref:Uncharacterized protein n=1 Tax=Acanthochromis polyacanthus TaxID=80966 RepID=A0A3Q1EA43_9TELE